MIKVLCENVGEKEVELPEYASPGASGVDFRAAIFSPIELLPGRRVLVPTGLRFELPPGVELQIRPRSGLALKHGITVLNSPGTVDSDYRGEVQILLINLGEEKFVIEPEMRIAQGVFVVVSRAELCRAEGALQATERNDGGFGHTGVH
nr:dUTP diphosphatase [Chlamydiifrater phoenicopteri]